MKCIDIRWKLSDFTTRLSSNPIRFVILSISSLGYPGTILSTSVLQKKSLFSTQFWKPVESDQCSVYFKTHPFKISPFLSMTESGIMLYNNNLIGVIGIDDLKILKNKLLKITR